jgi:lipopolysaccharide/colanic/teichoic acid biosynthesis glycosyltransferase
LRTTTWSNPLSQSSLAPSWASAPNGFQPWWAGRAKPLDALRLLLRRLRSAALPRQTYPMVSWAKRGLDMTVAALALALLSPLLLVVAAAIALTDGGPVLFWQQRVGLYGEPFQFPKFRSMVRNAEAMKQDLMAYNRHRDGVTFKMQKDPRVTRIGGFLRRFSIDELPQLWCVLKGDMSLVGPRPAVPQEVERYTPRHCNRLHTLPGLTCIWQVSGRSEIPFEQQVKLDEQYIQQQSFWLDLSLLARTVPAVIGGRGAC